MARFFINRPIFAWVLAIIVMMGGIIGIYSLPVEQYPEIAPPTITVTATYPGASSQTVENTVTQVIEQSMKGLDGLDYMSSNSASNGTSTVTLVFRGKINPDTAQVQVQNKLSLVTASLPASVQQTGVRVTKASTGFLEVIAFISKDGRYTSTELADFLASNIQDPISRADGVGSTQIFGGQYAMRVWLDPDKLLHYKMTVSDVTAAISSKNVQVSAGEVGGLPAVQGQQLNATITAQSKLKSVDEFKQIILRTTLTGANVRLKDVARIELGSESYATSTRYNGQPSAAMAISLASGSNALNTANNVDKTLAELSKTFPEGIEFKKPYDTTPFVKLSIEEVVKTLVEAVVLVFLVMYLFLQNFRATLIPTIAVPVVLLGTFFVLFSMGYSVNTLTMFAMVLAIGLLVDDAIVVVENVERIMSEEGLPPKEATIKSMGQIAGALISVAIVLSTVFVPMAFFGGSIGVIFRQFSVTIVAAMVLSVLVAMILTPALCATMLKPIAKGHTYGETGFFGKFNQWFNATTQKYLGGVNSIVKRGARFILIFVALIIALGFAFTRLPTSFVPDEDMGILMVTVQLPAGSTDEHASGVLNQVVDYFKQQPAVDATLSVNGFSFSGSGQNMGIVFVKLKDWKERKAANMKAAAVQQKANMDLAQIRDAMVFAIAPPPIRGLGTSSGFDVQLKDVGSIGHDALMQARNQLLGMSKSAPNLVAVRPNGLEDAPQLKVNVNEEMTGAMGIPLSDIYNTLTVAWGSQYINDFIDRGRVKKVYVQGDAPFRMQPSDLNRWYVRNNTGGMVPFGAFASSEWQMGSPRLERFNGQPSVNVVGSAAPGSSSGEAMKSVQQFIGKLPAGVDYEWSGLSRVEQESGSKEMTLYAISIVFVFLCLAALYESWSTPTAVLMAAPLGLLGAVVFALLNSKANDVYFKVGMLTTIGLTSKNAILIIEFAKVEYEKGTALLAAVVEAARLRIRPIIMTSLAFVLGVLPMYLASGAGSGAQNAIGTAVVGGMITGTLLVVFFVPLFFVVVTHLTDKLRGKIHHANTSNHQGE